MADFFMRQFWNQSEAMGYTETSRPEGFGARRFEVFLDGKVSIKKRWVFGEMKIFYPELWGKKLQFDEYFSEGVETTN